MLERLLVVGVEILHPRQVQYLVALLPSSWELPELSLAKPSGKINTPRNTTEERVRTHPLGNLRYLNLPIRLPRMSKDL